MVINLSILLVISDIRNCPVRIDCVFARGRCWRSWLFSLCCSELHCCRLAVCCAVSLDTYCDESVLSLWLKTSYGNISLRVLLERNVALFENICDSLVYVRLSSSKTIPCIFCCTVVLYLDLCLVCLYFCHFKSEGEVFSVLRSCSWTWFRSWLWARLFSTAYKSSCDRCNSSKLKKLFHTLLCFGLLFSERIEFQN